MTAMDRWWLKLLCAAGIVIPPEESGQKKSWRGFVRRVVLAIPVMTLLILLTCGADYIGLFRGFETAHLDTMLRLHPRDMSRNVVIVEVTKADYHDLFNGTSPLDKFKLLELVKAIKQYGPSVIGVDFDTNDWSPECQRRDVDPSCAAKCAPLREQLDVLHDIGDTLAGSTKQKPVVVWAAVPQTLESPLKIGPVVGGVPLKEPDGEGIPRFPVDPDGSVRHYESQIEVAAKPGGSCPGAAEPRNGKCYELTLARAVLKAYPQRLEEGPDEPVIFNFYGDRYRFPTIDSNNFLPTKAESDPRPPEEQREKDEIDRRRAQLLEGKIVLIGGGYAEARDSYTTPLGVMDGVVLNALAIQTDLSGGGIKEINRIEEVLGDVGISVFIVWAFYWRDRRPWAALGRSLLTIPAALVLSAIAFRTFAYWFNFIPAAVGMVGHQLYELAGGWAEAQDKMEEISRERAEGALAVAANAPKQAVPAAESATPQVDQAANPPEIKAKRAASGA